VVALRALRLTLDDGADIDGQRQLAEPLGGPADETQPSADAAALPPDAEAGEKPEPTAQALATTEAAR